MTSRIIHTRADLESWTAYLLRLDNKLPITVSWKAGADRSLDQNKLMWKWNTEIAKHLGDRTPQEVHDTEKVETGIPIMRADDMEFDAAYREGLARLPYHIRFELIRKMSVTSAFTVKQMSQYLDTMERKWRQRGVKLTDPALYDLL